MTALRVYVSLPLRGPMRTAGRDVLRGGELALERDGRSDIELVVLDASGDERDERAAENARVAAADPRAMAYLGDFHSSQVARSAPILEAGSLLAVAPVATWVGLAGATLVRLMPHDGVGARAVAAWLADVGVDELLVVHDHDHGYGIPVGAMCVRAAQDRGLVVRSRPVWDHDEAPADDLGAADAVLYVGVAGSGAVDLWRGLHASNCRLWLLGSDGVATDWLAAALEPPVAARTRFFVAARAPLAFYGFQAMRHILDALSEGGGDRAGTVRAGRSARERDSVLGRYSLDDDGHTTCPAYGRLAVLDGELVPDRSTM